MGIPIVAIDRSVDDQRADAVIGDNIDAARLATRHFIVEAGRRKMGLVSGRMGIQTGVDLLAGYERTVADWGMPAVVANGAFRSGAAQQATVQLLRDHPRFDVLVVANNLMVIGVLHALRAAGKRIAEDIAVVRIDNPPWADLVDPAVTALGQPIPLMAAPAFDLLVDRITTQRAGARVVIFSFELFVRDSCGTVGEGR